MSSNHDTPTSCNASDRPAARDRVGADDAPARSGSRVGRRTFVKGIGATAVAAAGLSHERGFAQNADAIAPLVAGAIVAGSVGVGDEIGSLEPGKRADIILLDVEQPKFTPLTNIPAQVVNNATPADVGVVIVDGDVLMHDGNVKTMDADAVRDRVETAIDRFELETDWELGIGGASRRVR